MSVDFDGGSSALFESLTFYVAIVDDVYSPGFEVTILDNIPIDETDVGQQVTLSAVDGPTFEQVADRLTDGVDDYVDLQVELGGGSARQAARESVWIDGGLSGTLDPDFAGFEIGSVTLVIDAVSFDSPGQDPNNDGIWTDYSFQARIVVVGRPAAP